MSNTITTEKKAELEKMWQRRRLPGEGAGERDSKRTTGLLTTSLASNLLVQVLKGITQTAKDTKCGYGHIHTHMYTCTLITQNGNSLLGWLGWWCNAFNPSTWEAEAGGSLSLRPACSTRVSSRTSSKTTHRNPVLNPSPWPRPKKED